MATITYRGEQLALNPGETVLERLERAGVRPAFSCRAGSCQSCLMRATDGTPPPESQRGLRDTLRARSYFLPCIARPESDLGLAQPDDSLYTVQATIESVTPLNDRIVKVLLRTERPLDYQAGQFINLVRPDGLVRSYSLASLPGRDELLELHVQLNPGGQMSEWLRGIKPGQQATVRGPAGDCYYLPGQPEQPILLLGTGTGLAPLYGLAQEALRQGHKGPITLIHGTLVPPHLYMAAELRELAAQNPQLRYLPCVLADNPEGSLAQISGGAGIVSPLPALLSQRFPSLKGYRVFLCGDPVLVNSLRRLCFLLGAARKDIAADLFLQAQVKTPA